MAGPVGHAHVSEREAGRWWSCVWCSGVMLARSQHAIGIPATLDEAHALCIAGKGNYGAGSTGYQLAAGLKARYGYDSHVVTSFTQLWASLSVGTSAAVMGSMGAFPVGHSLRRWDPAFAGIHDVFVARLDTQDRVWWDDPLAPTSYRVKGKPVVYNGQWVSKADLARFVNAFAGTSVVGFGITNAPQEPVMASAPVTNESPALITLAPGPWYDHDGKTVLANGGALPARLSPYGVGALRAMYATISGVRRIVLVKPSSVTNITDTTPYSKADVDHATQEGLTAGIGKEKTRVRDLLGL